MHSFILLFVPNCSSKSDILSATLALIHRSFVFTMECVVVIDGANVACQKDGNIYIPKLAAAIQFFQSLQRTAGDYPIKCVAFAPNFWLNAKPPSSSSGGCRDDSSAIGTDGLVLLKELVQNDAVILTPSHAHDDLYVIDYAVKYDGFIVTNDMFRDHVSNKRSFHGKTLTRNWARSHCVDFTFVGKEFMPNPRAMERVFSFQPSASSDSPLASAVPLGAAVENSTEAPKSSLQKTLSSDDGNQGEADDDVDEDGMVIDHAGARRRKNIDLSEVTYYTLPRELLPMLHGEGGITMEKFQEYTGTYIVLPSYTVLGSPMTRPMSDVLTLSIYGVRMRSSSTDLFDILV
uniref:RNase NYN domain-containing protein n=1 Tax=Hyaloperonospora arabidopsidis (strain Emoy2) TaxID=559515 RepID=M4BAX1_HYAAE